MKLICQICGYEWDYRGRLATATCPSCLSKVKVQDAAPPDDPEQCQARGSEHV